MEYENISSNMTNTLNKKYKGVVRKPNGRWGAQIYANHKRYWLGTFETEVTAAGAYDSAAIKIRGENPLTMRRNIAMTDLDKYEPDFQENYSTDEVVSMIKDGSYKAKFNAFVSPFISQVNARSQTYYPKGGQSNLEEGYFCQELFKKKLTSSDVGKLYRLVIPKRYALKCFPIFENRDMDVVFYDKQEMGWIFKYCYWPGSKIFVFTKGWNQFVKKNGLEAKDTLIFYKCELRRRTDEFPKRFLMMDFEKYASETKKSKGFKLFGVQIEPVDNNEEN